MLYQTACDDSTLTHDDRKCRNGINYDFIQGRYEICFKQE